MFTRPKRIYCMNTTENMMEVFPMLDTKRANHQTTITLSFSNSRETTYICHTFATETTECKV